MTTTTAPRAEAREGFRQAMSWLHTWAGLVLGWLMFAIFLTGTLAYFRHEINAWAQPELYALPPADAHAPARALSALHAQRPQLTQWSMRLPDERQQALLLRWQTADSKRLETWVMNPATGAVLEPRQSMGGDFFYRFHFELRTAQKGRWIQEGRWVVGAATLAMLMALLTGIVTHRRIFKDFFTFRPSKNGQRAWLDAHNVSGVLSLPFYLMMTFSGLMIFHSMYMPAGIAAAYQGPGGVDTQAYLADLAGDKRPERQARAQPGQTSAPLPLLPVNEIIASAQQHWSGAQVRSIQARRDAHGELVVEVTRRESDRIQYRPQRLQFDEQGRLLQALDAPPHLALQTYGVLYGLHVARFADMGLRWTLFALGLLGSAMIATGLVLWCVKRQAQAQRKNAAAPLPWGHHLVASLNVTVLGGLPLACAAFLLGNRLLPPHAAQRADAEIACFFSAWGLVLLWGLWRHDRRGWCGIWAANALAWLALPVVNAATTPWHLPTTAMAGQWTWVTMELSFIAAGALAAWMTWRLRPTHPTAAQPTPHRAAMAKG